MVDERRPNWFFISTLFVVVGLLKPVSAQDVFECDYTTDIDQDNDGLIELCDLDALDAVRYQLDGSGYRESFDAVKVTAGCPRSGCNGYELRKDLDFNIDDNYRDLGNKAAWTSGSGWLPIGDRLNFFTARFEGNGHTIANLYIDRPSDYVGLFRATSTPAKISDLILSQINIEGNSYTGGLIGWNYAHQMRDAATTRVIHSYWNSKTVGISLSAGGHPRTTEQLQSPTAPGLPRDGMLPIGISARANNTRYSNTARVLKRDTYCRVNTLCCRVCSYWTV